MFVFKLIFAPELCEYFCSFQLVAYMINPIFTCSCTAELKI